MKNGTYYHKKMQPKQLLQKTTAQEETTIFAQYCPDAPQITSSDIISEY